MWLRCGSLARTMIAHEDALSSNALQEHVRKDHGVPLDVLVERRFELVFDKAAGIVTWMRWPGHSRWKRIAEMSLPEGCERGLSQVLLAACGMGEKRKGGRPRRGA